MTAQSRSLRPSRRGRAAPGARLTGGEACGRRLHTVSGDGLRASTGVVRAACFNILGAMVLGARVVDLFAGAGSLGIEALSRGAASATFVELRRDRAAIIDQNLEMLGYGPRSEVAVANVIPWLRASTGRLLSTSLVLMDPPYQDQGPSLCRAALERLGEDVGRNPAWNPVVVVEHHRGLVLADAVGALNCVRDAHYGTTQLTFYRRRT